MVRFLAWHRRTRFHFSKSARSEVLHAVSLLRETRGSALLEFAVALPLLVVFIVGIYDFSGAFNQKQKIEQAAQEGAIIAGAQPMSDIAVGNANPDSLQPVVTAIFYSLAGSGVLPSAGSSCTFPPAAPTQAGLAWTYKIVGCSGDPTDQAVITINRGWVAAGPPAALGTTVLVSYPYHWRFNTAIQLLFPGANFAAITQLTESATVHNQL